MEAYMIWVWMGAMVLFGVVEAATAGLVCIWFALGALAGMLAAFLGAGIGLQTGAFLLVSAVTLALTRPLVRKYRSEVTPTNADRVIGETAKVKERIRNDDFTGAVYVDGKTWSACSEDGSEIPEGTLVIVERMEGVKLFVRPVEKKEEKA